MKSEDPSPFQAKRGIVYLVGAGPGDPGLITVKGLAKIRSAEVIVYDYLAGEAFLHEARPDAELIYVGKKGKDHTAEQMDINDLLVTKAAEGKTIVRLKGGDPYVFGRGGEEAEELAKAGVPFEVVPGVTSAVAAPAYAGIPVTHRDHASMVTFITGHENPGKETSAIDWAVLARNPGTLVFLMGVKNLPVIADSLVAHGKAPDTPAALIRWGTTPRQVSLVSTLGGIVEEARRREIKAPAVLLIGSVAELHDRLGWFEQKPLFGKRVLVTRAREQSRRMTDRIRDFGGEPIPFPTLRFAPPEDFSPLDEAIERIATFDWIIFTSANGVDRFFERFFHLRDDIRHLAGPRIAAIGPITASAIQARGLRVERVAGVFTAEGILGLFSEDEVPGRRFLIARAAVARETLPEGLRAMGDKVTVVPVYRTITPPDSEVGKIRGMLESGEVDVVTFTSSSTVTHFVGMLPQADLSRLLESVVLASIGPITSRTLSEVGLRVDVEAAEYTVDGLVEALAGHFRKSGAKGPDVEM